MRASLAAPERELLAALRPWSRRLAVEALARWTVRGATAALVLACMALAVGWFVPRAASELRPLALQVAAPALLIGVLIGLWPMRPLRRAAELDLRLGLADRLATAWTDRGSRTPMAELQRADALARLGELSPRTHLRPRLARLEVGGLIGLVFIAQYLLLASSPMQAVLDRQAAEQRATELAATHLEQLRQDPALAENLSAEQAQQLDELLQAAHRELSAARSEREASAILARTEQQLMQLGDPTADERDQALGAMSETLAQEPLTRAISDALERNDARATENALRTLNERIDQMSEAQRQGVARALQRAANVGRADSRSSSALRDAARAVAAGERPEGPLGEAAASLDEAMRAAAAQASLRSTSQRMQDVRDTLATGKPPPESSASMSAGGEGGLAGALPDAPGTAVPIDSGSPRRSSVANEGRGDASGDRASGAGVGAAAGGANPEVFVPASPSESVFVPGRPGDGPADEDLQQQPFSVRGAPRPYREVIGQYAQSGRDAVDRAAVAPTVRELVRQYFADLEAPER